MKNMKNMKDMKDMKNIIFFINDKKAVHRE